MLFNIARCVANAIPAGEAYSKLVPDPPSVGDFCHVYVLDVEKARKVYASDEEPKSAKGIETIFPEFRTDIGEESLTTKTFPFPDSKLIITATVYYTDESMGSTRGADSMLMGIAVAPTVLKDALVAENNSFAELTFYDRDKMRVKKYLTVGGRKYLLGMECKSSGHNTLP